MNPISKVFANAQGLNQQLLQELAEVPDPRSRYLIAITPRSGSTYLCDALKQTKRLGRPQELLGVDSVANRIVKNMPGQSPEEYLRNGLRVTKSKAGVSGLKASWFQFEIFNQAVSNRNYLKDFKFIYLTRRDLAAQSVSLYKATATDIFHSHIPVSEESLSKLKILEYDFKAIKYWYDHIVAQEKGWQRFFYEHRIYPYCLSYEDISEDIVTVIKRLAFYVSVNPNHLTFPETLSDLQKLGDTQSQAWACRFNTELSLNACH